MSAFEDKSIAEAAQATANAATPKTFDMVTVSAPAVAYPNARRFVAGTNVAISTAVAGEISVSASYGPTTIADVDFTAQAPETISANVSRTWSGVTFQIYGNAWGANESLVISAAGATMTNNAASNVVILSTLLSSLALTSNDNYRVWLYLSQSAAVAAGTSITAPGVKIGRRQSADGVTFTSPLAVGGTNGWGAAQGTIVSGFDGIADDTVNANAVWASKDVIVFQRQSGNYRLAFGTYAAGFPALTALRNQIERPTTVANENSASTGWLESESRLYIDLRNGSGFPTQSITLKRLLIQKL